MRKNEIPERIEIVETKVVHKAYVDSMESDCECNLKVDIAGNGYRVEPWLVKLRNHEILCKENIHCDKYEVGIANDHAFHSRNGIDVCNEITAIEDKKERLQRGVRINCPNGHQMIMDADIDRKSPFSENDDTLEFSLHWFCQKDCEYHQSVFTYNDCDSNTFGHKEEVASE